MSLTRRWDTTFIASHQPYAQKSEPAISMTTTEKERSVKKELTAIMH